MKVVRVIKMCLNVTCSRDHVKSVHVNKNLFDMFPIKNDLKEEVHYCHCLSPLL
jgi:hypothetical protein